MSKTQAPSAKAGSPSKAKPAASISSKPVTKAVAAKVNKSAAPIKRTPPAKPVAASKPKTAAKKPVAVKPAAPTKAPPAKAPPKTVTPKTVTSKTAAPQTVTLKTAAPKAPAPKAAAPVVVVPAPPPPRKSSKKQMAAPPAPISLPVRDLPPAAPSRPLPMHLPDDVKTRRKVDPKLVNVWKTKAGRDLSEDELQAMPEAEYMKDKQLEYFRAMLMQQRDDLLNNAGETTEHLREDTSIVPDPADRATIEEEHALELRTRDRERKLLKKISQSIGRIDAGDYGYCDETGEPIGLGRLLARPTATLSLEAQQRRELKQKMFGD